ncbi:MAG TPA: hypothetical protein VJX30_13265 [Terriglobales bacterium]|jgi:hypothetical protein|nr:hypothetical protein [Terriglobales bacterium]
MNDSPPVFYPPVAEEELLMTMQVGMVGRGNVVPGTPIFFARNGVEVFLDNLLSPG